MSLYNKLNLISFFTTLDFNMINPSIYKIKCKDMSFCLKNILKNKGNRKSKSEENEKTAVKHDILSYSVQWPRKSDLFFGYCVNQKLRITFV
jgi:hypothetical protein